MDKNNDDAPWWAYLIFFGILIFHLGLGFYIGYLYGTEQIAFRWQQ